MNHQTSNAGRDITAHIGALELSAINAFDDGALEATVHAGPGPSFPPSLPPMCRRIDDGALEASIQVGPGPSGLTRFPSCMPRIDDGELEATVHAGPSTHLRRSTVCLNIDDRALEASIQAGPSPTMPGYPGCRFRIDDGELEATIQAGPSTMPPACRFHIDDGALEQAAAHADVGPSVQRVAGRCY